MQTPLMPPSTSTKMEQIFICQNLVGLFFESSRCSMIELDARGIRRCTSMLAAPSEPTAAGCSRQAELQLLSQSNLILTWEVVAKAREWQHRCAQRQPVDPLTLHSTPHL